MITRTRLLGLALALAAVSAAVWVLLARRDPAGATSESDAGPSGSDADRGRPGLFGGVAARPSDARGDYDVLAEIVDEDGQPIEEGTAVLTCLEPTGVRPISGGVVSIGAGGVLEGPGCAFEVCVEFRHPSKVPQQAWVLVPSKPATLTARTLPRLEGWVVNTAQEPIEAAIVTFTRPREQEVDPRSVLPLMTRSTVTDAEGRFTVAWIERPPCDPCREATVGCDSAEIPFVDAFAITVRAPGYGPAQRELTVDEGLEHTVDAPLRIELPDSLDILSGRLVDPDGAAYPRAYVLARSVERPAEQRRGEVDGSNFEIDGLGSGSYGLRAIQDGVELATAQSVRPGHDVLLTGSVVATGPDVTLVVVDARGRPATARIDGGPFRDAVTNAQGEVSAPTVLPGELRVRVRVPGRKAFMKTFTIQAGERSTPADAQAVRLTLSLEAERP